MKEIIVTGGTGLIGSKVIKPLYENGYKIYLLSRNEIKNDMATCIKCDIFNEKEIESIFKNVKPKYLLHLAWFTGENYLHSNINFDYINASLNILKYFTKYGGARALLTGTCFEYDFEDNFEDKIIKESSKLNPTTVYAKCKNILK